MTTLSAGNSIATRGARDPKTQNLSYSHPHRTTLLQAKPGIYATYNGDWFDWPFIETRALKHGMDMHDQIGFRMNRKTNECLSKSAVHMDCLCWVNRDSYLPQGSRGLKVSSSPFSQRMSTSRVCHRRDMPVIGSSSCWGVSTKAACSVYLDLARLV